MPLLTIVTIVRNHRDGLIKTVDSVKSQTFTDYEYIVVDGASTDGTLDAIKEREGLFDKVLYGPDKGIYDAMNKGAKEADGRYVMFMNAGDTFTSDKVLERLLRGAQADVIYGDYIVDYGFTTKYIKAKNTSEFWKGMITSHQAFAVNTMMVKEHPFDLSVKIGADFDMLYGFYADGASFSYVPVAVSVMEPGGLSDVRRIDVYRDHLKTIKKYEISAAKQAYYLYIFADTWLRQFVKSLLPKKLVRKIIGAKTEK